MLSKKTKTIRKIFWQIIVQYKLFFFVKIQLSRQNFEKKKNLSIFNISSVANFLL